MKRKWLLVAVAVITLGGIAVAGCSGNNGTARAQTKEARKQNALTGRLIQNQPLPPLSYSADRAALIKRYQKTGDQNFVQYIAVVTPFGQILFTGAVKGKVTPLDSQLTPADVLDCEHNGGSTPDGCGVVQLAEPNGTWGTNGGGVFWFDPSGVMHETSMPYILADQPFTLSSPPLLTIQAEAGK